MLKLAGAPAVDDAGPVERVARIADVIRSAGDRNEKLRRLAHEVVDALHEQRLFRLLLPRAFGGDEVDLVTWFNTMEALGKLDASTGWCVGQINGCSATANAIDPSVARKIWGEPRGALSWGPPVKSRAEEVDRIMGLELGGDGYVTKPFSPRELTTRVKAVLRRTSAAPRPVSTSSISYGPVEIDRDKHEVRVKGERVTLTYRPQQAG